MKGISSVAVEGLMEDGEVTVPLRSAKEENVVSIDLSNGCRQLPIDRFKLDIQRRKAGIVRDRLVQKIVAKHRWVVLVMTREALPDRHEMRLLSWTIV